MKITTSLAVAFACATLAACGGGGEQNTENADANMMMTDNLGTDMNMDMNATDMNMDMNATTDMNMDMNATGNTTGNMTDGNTTNTM